MSLPSLFLEQAQQSDQSKTKLPQDMDLWAEKIVSKIKSKLPQTRNMLLKVQFLKRNEELGTATGSVAVHNEKLDKIVYIPLVSKNFSLCPLDIMMLPNKDEDSGFETVPLSRDRFDEALFNGQVFDHLERPMDRVQQMYLNPQNANIHPPSYRNVHASAQILDAIKGTIDPHDKGRFFNEIKSNNNILIGYEKYANFNILQKIADAKIELTDKPAMLKNITLIKKDLAGQYHLTSTSDEVFDPIVKSKEGRHTAGRDLSNIIENPEESLNEVDRNGEHMVFNDLVPSEDAMVWTNNMGNYTDTSDKTVDAKTFGTYKVQDANGVYYKGVVFPNVISFDMKPLGTRIFHCANKVAYQNVIKGILSSEDTHQHIRFRDPEIGMTGTFVAKNDKNAIATFPITIRSLAEKDGSDWIVGMDLNGKKIKIRYGGWGQPTQMDNKQDFHSEVKLERIAKVKDYYVIPDRFGFLPMENFCELSNQEDSILQKAASFRGDVSPIRVIYTGSSQFSLKGPDIVKMASKLNWEPTNLSATEAIFLLSAKKCPLTKVSTALKTAANYEETSIHGLPRVVFGEDVAKKNIKIASAYCTLIKGLQRNLIKEASHFEDSQLVDTALSLNFVNPDNVQKFIGFVPYFEQAIKMLAQSVMASRLGMNEIPEEAAGSAMRKMDEVIKGLRRLADHKSEEL